MGFLKELLEKFANSITPSKIRQFLWYQGEPFAQFSPNKRKVIWEEPLNLSVTTHNPESHEALKLDFAPVKKNF